MSHDATNWAIKQRGLKPAAKIVLWHLCDRYHPDHGCFPAQETLARDCEMSRSTLNEHLDALEAAGLIRRERRMQEGTYRVKTTRYYLAFEDETLAGFVPKPCPETGHGSCEKPCPEKAESRVRNPDTIPVREPVREEKESACADAQAGADTPAGAPAGTDAHPVDGPPASGTEGQPGETPDSEAAVPAFEAFWRIWPNKAVDNRGKAFAAWTALPAADRAGAITGLKAWLEAVRGAKRRAIVSASTYLAERKWAELEAADLPGATPAMVTFGHWSREWWAVLLARLERKATVGSMVEMAGRNRKGQWSERAPDMPNAATIAALKAHPSDGDVFKRWERWFAGRGVRFDLTDRVWVWLPSADPPGDAAKGSEGEARVLEGMGSGR